MCLELWVMGCDSVLIAFVEGMKRFVSLIVITVTIFCRRDTLLFFWWTSGMKINSTTSSLVNCLWGNEINWKRSVYRGNTTLTDKWSVVEYRFLCGCFCAIKVVYRFSNGEDTEYITRPMSAKSCLEYQLNAIIIPKQALSRFGHSRLVLSINSKYSIGFGNIPRAAIGRMQSYQPGWLE